VQISAASAPRFSRAAIIRPDRFDSCRRAAAHRRRDPVGRRSRDSVLGRRTAASASRSGSMPPRLATFTATARALAATPPGGPVPSGACPARRPSRALARRVEFPQFLKLMQDRAKSPAAFAKFEARAITGIGGIKVRRNKRLGVGNNNLLK